MALALLTLSGCNADPSALPPTTLAKVGEVRPLGVPGWELLDTLKIRSLGDDGIPRTHQLITWSVPVGGGSIRALDNVTDAHGEARAIWMLGGARGVNRVVAATADDQIGFEVIGTAFVAERLDSDYGGYCALRNADLWCGPYPASAPYSRGREVPNPYGTTFGGPVRVTTGGDYVEVAKGEGACVLDRAGGAYCLPLLTASATLAPVTGLPPVHRLAGSGRTMCAIALADSTAWCWRPGFAPAKVNDSLQFVQLNVEGGEGIPAHACGVRADALAMCWQGNAPPVLVSDSLTFAEVVVEYNYACGRRPTTDIYCWGSNSTVTRSSTPVTVPKLMATGATSITAGANTVGFMRGARAMRWGGGQYGDIPEPAPLPGFENVLVAGFAPGDISCLLLLDGQVSCFHEIWINSTSIDIDEYLLVQPVAAQATEQ